MWCLLGLKSHKWLLFSVKLLFTLCRQGRNVFLVNRPVNGTPSEIPAARAVQLWKSHWQQGRSDNCDIYDRAMREFFCPCFLMRDCKCHCSGCSFWGQSNIEVSLQITTAWYPWSVILLTKLHWQIVKLKLRSQWDSECFQSFCCRSITCKRVMKRLIFCWTAFSFHRKFRTTWNELCLSTSPPYLPSSSSCSWH